MYELVHRYAPESPAGRITVVIAASLVGLWILAFGFIEQSHKDTEAFLYLVISAATFVIGGQLARGIVRQANGAPTTKIYDKPDSDNTTETPIKTLRRRYTEN